MTDKHGREVVLLDKTQNLAIIEDKNVNDYLIVSHLDIKDNILDYRNVIKFVKSLDYAKILFNAEHLLFEV